MDPRYLLRRSLVAERWPEEVARERGTVYRGPADFVLREGRWWNVEPGLPPGVDRWGAPRACFGNAITLSVVHGLRYVQGFALHPLNREAIPISHAWLADASGRAWDVTWRQPGLAYLGVELSAERADDGTWNGDAEPIDDYNRGWPLLRERWRGETGETPWEPSYGLLAARLYRDGDHEGARVLWLRETAELRAQAGEVS